MPSQHILNRAGTVLVAGALSLLASATLIAPVAGQTLWTGGQADGDARPMIQLEMFRPTSPSRASVFTAPPAQGSSRHGCLTPRWAVVADLPFARASWSVEDETGMSKMIGNPYVGAELRATDRVTAEAGGRLPTGDLDEGGRAGGGRAGGDPGGDGR